MSLTSKLVYRIVNAHTEQSSDQTEMHLLDHKSRMTGDDRHMRNHHILLVLFLRP